MQKRAWENEISKVCSVCDKCAPMFGSEHYMCKKHGVVRYDYTCRHFNCDPLKIKPHLHRLGMDFEPSSMELG